MELLIGFLVACVIFGIIGVGLYLICKYFFANFQPAFWISGAILLIIVLVYAFRMASGGKLPGLP